jgi:hypothetical protein
VYKDFAERMIQDFEQQQATQSTPPAPVEEIGATSAYGEPVASANSDTEESDR